MIGSYPAEVAWLTGKADDSAYLRASIEPFGAVEFLARNAPGDDVFGIDACTGLYAANPDRLYGFCGARRSYALGLAPRETAGASRFSLGDRAEPGRTGR